MKIIVTGSLGHISKPLTETLVAKGYDVTVISSKAAKQKDIEALGATAAIGTLEDVDFLTTTFTRADAVYCMEPPFNIFDKNLDYKGHLHKLGNNYAEAIQQSGVKRVIHLSSIGAHTDKGNGMLAFHHRIENILNQLPEDVSITFMRPVGFYYNLFAFVQSIKTQGFIASNYGADDMDLLVSPTDIADAIAEEIETPNQGRKIRYVASDERTCNEVAAVLGTAIGKPDLKWIVVPDEQVLNGLKAAGINAEIASGLVEMNASRHSGKLFEDYYKHKPTLGKVKTEDFAKEFAAAFNSN